MREEQSPRLRVLVVEDEFLIRWAIAETLAQRGHTIIEADSAKAAIRALAEEPEAVDVVLLDLRLPDSTDLTLLARIRHLAPTSGVVLMTAFGTPEVIANALTLGARRVLSKPFDMDEIARSVHDAGGARTPADPAIGFGCQSAQ